MGLLVPELPVSGVGEIAPHQGVVAHRLGGSEGAVQPVVPAAHPLVEVAVQGHPQHQLLRRDPGVQVGLDAVRHAVLVLGRALGRGVERGVQVGIAVPGPVDVVGHEEDVIHYLRHRLGLDIAQIALAGGPGDGEQVVLPISLPLLVQPRPDGLEEQGEVLSVLGAVDGAGEAAGDWILPVQVDPIQAMLSQEGGTAPGEGVPPGGGGGHVGEIGGVVPAPHRDEQLQMGVLLPQLPQGGQGLPVVVRVSQGQLSALRVYRGEGVVDVGEQVGGQRAGRVALIGGPARVVAHYGGVFSSVCSACPGGAPPWVALADSGQSQTGQAQDGQKAGGAG